MKENQWVVDHSDTMCNERAKLFIYEMCRVLGPGDPVRRDCVPLGGNTRSNNNTD